MKTRLILLCILPFIHSMPLKAQKGLPKYAGIEAGICFISANMQEMDFIRGNISSFTSGFYTPFLRSYMNKAYAGAKGEYITRNNRFGFSTGLRYVQMNSLLGPNTYWTNSNDYFYLKYREEGLTTEYAKVREITQTTSYLGLPLEARFFPYNAKLFRIYFKLAGDLDFRLLSNTDIAFYNSSMEEMEDEVAALISNPGPLSASLTISTGLRIGREDHFMFNLEAGLPAFFLTSGSSGLLNPRYGGGFQITFQMPLKSLHQ